MPKRMHGERLAPTNTEKIKATLTETQRKNLILLNAVINGLDKSLTDSTNHENIKSIYGRILDEQSGERPSPLLIDQLKENLISSYMEHYEKFYNLTHSDLPESLYTYFQELGVNLKDLAREMLGAIGAFMAQKLTSDIYKNKFRLSVWIEKIQQVKFALNPLL